MNESNRQEFTPTADGSIGEKEAVLAHRAAVCRKRRLIFNNDGDDVLYHAKSATPEGLVAVRAGPITGTHVDTMFYCSNGSMGQFHIETDLGDILFDDLLPGTHNITKALVEKGTDSLAVMVAHCRRHGIEIFSTIRMNDIHDGAGYSMSASLFPRFKKEHPEYLFGTCDERPVCGYWSGVDYGHQGVRDMAFAIAREYCTRYDIDGIELDFWRHPPFFKRQAWGERATGREREWMTDFMRRIRVMTRAVEEKRGKPLLVAVRILETLELSRDYGLDLLAWLREDLIDMISTGEGSEMPWQNLIDLGHQYGVPVYPCLRRHVRPEDGQLESLRAQALAAYHIGADGLYLFNLFPEAGTRHHTSMELFQDFGDPARLMYRDKIFSFARSDESMGKYFRNLGDYMLRPPVTPEMPLRIASGRAVRLPVLVGDVFDDASRRPDVKVRVELEDPTALAALKVAVNLCSCDGPEVAGSGAFFASPAEALRTGYNFVELRVAQKTTAADVIDLQLSLTY